MDAVGKDASVEASNGEDMPLGWQVHRNNLANASVGMISICNSMVEPSVWDHPINGQNLGYCDVRVVQNDTTNSSNLDSVRAELGWSQHTLLRGGVFLPPPSGMVPQFPADSGFIERAARFSCFGGGSFGEMMNPFSVSDPLNPYTDVLGGNASKLLRVAEFSKEAALQKSGESLHDEVKQGVGGSGDESDEAECSGRGLHEEAGCATRESSGKGFGSKKRKRGGQHAQDDEKTETPPRSAETTKADQNTNSKIKAGSKNGKEVSQGSDQPKEEYIHVRARRGQATNSHSLAERVRREKISERMKFLQDLVPGCNKVTGKAVMLDEIINYVQSLQRQVEFLSMKLATVNPRLNFNIEGLLAKDILQSRAVMSSSLGLLPDISMPYPPIHPPQPGLIPACLPSNSSEPPRRPISLRSPPACGGFKDPSSQVSNVWEDELHNIVHMGFNSTCPPPSSQDLNGPLPPGHMKAEP